MSTAAATADAAPPPKGKKTLVIIAAAVVLVLVLGGVGAMLLTKKKPVDADGDEEAVAAKPAKAAKIDPKALPAFAPLDPFVVNLADRDVDRYAQVGITLELVDAKLGDQIKAFMPAIRHAVLMTLAEKTAAQLTDRSGKEKLARQVQRETSRVLGAEIEDEDEEAAAETPPKKEGKEGKGGKAKKKKAPPELPIRAVHFSSFIVQ